MPTDRIHGTPIDKRDTVSRILAALHRRIVGGKLKAGTPLPAERELAAELEVSRFSLREALRVAESQGLVEISRGKRTRVVVDSASSVVAAMDLTLRRGIASPLQLTEARLVVEVEVARRAAERMTPDLLAALQQTIDRYEQAAAGDVEIRVSQDLEFHQLDQPAGARQRQSGLRDDPCDAGPLDSDLATANGSAGRAGNCGHPPEDSARRCRR